MGFISCCVVRVVGGMISLGFWGLVSFPRPFPSLLTLINLSLLCIPAK